MLSGVFPDIYLFFPRGPMEADWLEAVFELLPFKIIFYASKCLAALDATVSLLCFLCLSLRSCSWTHGGFVFGFGFF